MTNGSSSIAFEIWNCVQIFLEIYTMSTYADVVSYIIREPEIQHVYGRQRNRFQEIEYLHGTEIQWWLRFKRGACHAKETSLKQDPLLIRFKRDFLLNRDPGVRETSLRPDDMGFRVPVAGINSAGRDARVVVINRSVQRAFYMFYTILLCVTGPTPSAIPPYYCVRYSSSRENRFLPWSQSSSNIISTQQPTTQRERYVSVTHLTSRKLVCESDSNQQWYNSHYP